eukprot:TRINITY_DN9691_c0_g1_i1.p1 TRINITY_DN9691_c0_g1~~TRINITY_DN9691_c0_g1_i1.p1  ORF type:complete len:562 (+),score=100.85 TRINITY_DN9691_c0_g1_i1:45-1688(+)
MSRQTAALRSLRRVLCGGRRRILSVVRAAWQSPHPSFPLHCSGFQGSMGESTSQMSPTVLTTWRCSRGEFNPAMSHSDGKESFFLPCGSSGSCACCSLSPHSIGRSSLELQVGSCSFTNPSSSFLHPYRVHIEQKSHSLASSLLLPNSKISSLEFTQSLAPAQRSMTTLADGKPAEAPGHTLLQRFPVQPGSALQVEVGGKTDIFVTQGKSLDEIDVQVDWVEPNSTLSEKREQSISFSSSAEGVEVKGLNLEEDGLGADAVTATIPERWCSVMARADKGSVHIDRIVEANMEISTNGSDVVIGDVRGLDAVVDTQGGSVKANSLYANVAVKSHGGDVQLKSCMGEKVDIDAGEGSLRVASVYAHEFKAKCSSFITDNFRSEKAEVEAGGDVIIHGLDGSASVISKGKGHVEIQLQPHAHNVNVTAEGDILIYVPSSIPSKISVSGSIAPTIDIPAHLVSVGGESQGRVTITLLPEAVAAAAAKESPRRSLASAVAAKSDAAGDVDVKTCNIFVNSSSGILTVKRRSWAEAAVAKITGSTVAAMARC